MRTLCRGVARLRAPLLRPPNGVRPPAHAPSRAPGVLTRSGAVQHPHSRRFATVSMGDGDAAVEKQKAPVTVVSANERLARSQTYTVAGLQLEGLSVGGQETCLVLPQYKVCFDIGRCPQRAVYAETALFSHTHLDHIAGLGAYVGSRCMLGLRPPNLVVPAANAPGVRALIDAFRVLDTSEMPHTLTPAQVGDEIALPNTNVVAKVFNTTHVVPSQGYLLASRKQKLKPQYHGLPGPEIKALREQGVEICDVIEVPEVAFTGDTTADWITNPANAQVLRARVLIMEVTFLDDTKTAADARAYGHTHISEVAAHADMFQNEAIVFIHFSARFNIEEIERELDERLPTSLRQRVTPLLNGFSHSASAPATPRARERAAVVAAERLGMGAGVGAKR